MPNSAATALTWRMSRFFAIRAGPEASEGRPQGAEGIIDRPEWPVKAGQGTAAQAHQEHGGRRVASSAPNPRAMPRVSPPGIMRRHAMSIQLLEAKFARIGARLAQARNDRPFRATERPVRLDIRN